MATNNPTECGVCQETFSEESRCPHTLPCSHHLCSDCIDQLIVKNSKICPFCRKDFVAKSSKDVMINHGLLECAKFMLQKTKTPKSLLRKSSLYQQRITEFKEEASKTNKEALDNLQGLKKQAQELINHVKELKKSFSQESTDLKEKILPEIHNTIKKIDINSENLDPAVHRLEDQLKNLDENEGLLMLAKGKLDSADSFEDVAAILDEAEETNIAVSGWAETLKESLAEEDGQLQTSRKEVIVSKKMKEDFMEVLGSKAEDVVVNPILNIGAAAEQKDLSNQLTAMALWQMSSSVKRLVEQQRLFAVQQEGDTRRSARITIENNRLHLYSLKDEPTPVPNAYYLQYQDVLRLVGSPGSMFLDIYIKGSTFDRIYILFESAASSVLPLHITGGKGFCYENTLRVLDKGSLLEQVLCGGKPTRKVIRHQWISINDPDFSLSKTPKWVGTCGSVAVLDEASSPPLFAIRTGPYVSSTENKIGNVKDGLGAVRRAVCCLDDETDASISNCGIVLSTEMPIANTSF